MSPTAFEPMFWTVFALSLVSIVLYWIVSIFRMFQGKQESENEIISEQPRVIKEREIIREIVKIRCPYCNNLYDEKEDECPHCGGRRL